MQGLVLPDGNVLTGSSGNTGSGEKRRTVLNIVFTTLKGPLFLKSKICKLDIFFPGAVSLA